MSLNYGGPGVSPSNKLGFGNRISLAPGQTWLIQPAGWYWVKPGPYTALQIYDPILLSWVTVGGGSASADPLYIGSDGENYRLANLTGCAVGASVTNVGSGYTSAPTVTASAGSSVWRPVIGGAVSQTVTVGAGGQNYTYPPNVLFSAPPAGGIQATGYVTLSGGAVSSITMVNQGGGYTSPPTITFVNDPREGINNVTLGYGAAATCALTGAKTIAGIICVDPGSGGLTSIPTFTISGGGGSSEMIWPPTSSFQRGSKSSSPSRAANSSAVNKRAESMAAPSRRGDEEVHEPSLDVSRIADAKGCCWSELYAWQFGDQTAQLQNVRRFMRLDFYMRSSPFFG